MTFKEKRTNDGFSVERVDMLTWWRLLCACSESVMSKHSGVPGKA